MENKPIQKMTKPELLDFINDKVNDKVKGVQTQYDIAKELTECIEKQQNQANDLMSKIHTQNENTETYVSEIEQQKSKITELTDKIEIQYNTITEFIEENQINYKELFGKIETLLPGATSAGLSSSYREARIEKKTKWYWVGFIVPLIILIGIYFYMLLSESNWMQIVTRTIVGLPLVWIAWYCQRSISQINRIKEEYHHKQMVMDVFSGFSKEIDELTKNNPEQNKEKKSKFISVVIDVIKKNPSEKIDPSETFLDLKNKKKKTNKDQTSDKTEEE